ncbi:dihydrofolate reductase family protein [Ruegeria sp. Ofav3-42]|uniref:dihydrofolate reductase family protein n=1 Tax=Ruegeria sp. Ofav3-42 TaxID=2917759 RepID=UPI001EF65F3C|nr:dihydrofolate reductase family protein [Ruegeria sp. Ofav3-42]MCG7522732.1 dihydrofolate reductase family protein [Ruegeria sp. Ofav3-42]
MCQSVSYVGYIAMSLDGFIADENGSVDWLNPFNEKLAADGGDGGYGDFISGIDALIMGRSTYEQVLGWGWPYEDRAGYVLTRQSEYQGNHVAAAGNIDALRNAIEQAGHQCVWVMGGGEAQRAALDAGMFDRLRIFIMPTLLGRGLPCFAPGDQRYLDLTEVSHHPGGILQIDYSIKH